MPFPAWLQSLPHRAARLRVRLAERLPILYDDGLRSLRLSVALLRARVVGRLRVRYDENDVLIPSPYLVWLVTSTFDTDGFLSSGKRFAEAIRDTLMKNGIDIARLESILDFGCGPGRVLRHLPALTGARLFGCDYNKKLVSWCRRNLRFAEFSISETDARLRYNGGSFDFIYALSVFTHFTEAQHTFWIDELRRVLRPGGYLLLTTHGKHYEQEIPAHLRKHFRDGELVVKRPDRAGENICAAFHPEKYVREELARGRDVVDFVEQGPAGNHSQDVYLLRKRRA
jgi:SAM-dependent methyltransferase